MLDLFVPAAKRFFRTSGTEPKIKFYLEGSGSDVTRLKAILPKVISELRDVWMEADKNGLKMP